jgi:hypothetical protein
MFIKQQGPSQLGEERGATRRNGRNHKEEI